MKNVVYSQIHHSNDAKPLILMSVPVPLFSKWPRTSQRKLVGDRTTAVLMA